MSLLGVHLTLLVGPTVPVPAHPLLAESIEEVKVTQQDTGRSGFQIVFRTGRGGPLGTLDYPLAIDPLLKAMNRVILMATIGVVPRVLMDGIITNKELEPGEKPGTAKVTITGEDVSLMMDLHEKSAEHPAQPELVIALKLIAMYATYGLVPMVIPPPSIDVPIPIQRTPVQQGTDLAYLQEMAGRFGYVFYISPGPLPGTNTAYWGPPIRAGVPQRAITVNMGAETNAKLGAFRTNALEPTQVDGQLQDSLTGSALPVRTFAPLRIPLATQPAWLVNQPHVRTTKIRESGVNVTQAYARAQGTTDAASDAVTVEGSLDAARYGGVLAPRGLVGVRGAGYQHDGLWYVRKVTHELKPGSYQQSFELAREGHGSTVPVVIP
jgi:hypothetical protein